MTIISGKPLLRTFKPHIHSRFQAHFFSTNKSHPRSCLNKATWEHEKKIPRNRSWEFLKKFLGTLQKIPGNQNLFTWLQTAERNNSQELFMEPDFFTWHKTRVSAMFPGTFPGIETASSWDLCPACQGSGGGVGNCPGDPWTTKEFHWTTRSICHVSLAMLVHSVRLARFQTPTISRPLC